MGAIGKVAPQHAQTPVVNYLTQSIREYCNRKGKPHCAMVSIWQDVTTRTHDDILQIIDRAIEIAEAYPSIPQP